MKFRDASCVWIRGKGTLERGLFLRKTRRVLGEDEKKGGKRLTAAEGRMFLLVLAPRNGAIGKGEDSSFAR